MEAEKHRTAQDMKRNIARVEQATPSMYLLLAHDARQLLDVAQRLRRARVDDLREELAVLSGRVNRAEFKRRMAADKLLRDTAWLEADDAPPA